MQFDDGRFIRDSDGLVIEGFAAEIIFEFGVAQFKRIHQPFVRSAIDFDSTFAGQSGWLVESQSQRCIGADVCGLVLWPQFRDGQFCGAANPNRCDGHSEAKKFADAIHVE